MLRKFLCGLVLVTMSLHCVSRVGLLSFFYEKRHSISLALGLIAEMPIAMCNHEYKFHQGLTLQDSEQGMPGLVPAEEINLFFVSIYCLPQPLGISPPEEWDDPLVDFSYLSPLHSIFHPPSLA